MMKKPDTILDEIHTIRRRIDDKTIDMTPSERTVFFNKYGEEAAKKYGFRRVASTIETDRAVNR
jgi:hypothetical protein